MPSEFCDVAIGLALEAGQVMRANFSLGMRREWKEDNTPLTITDTTINSRVIEVLQQHFPDQGILGEEESLLTGDQDYVWVCDPVDGTIPFSHGLPTSVFMLALTYKGESILGVVYDPYMDRLFVAEKGKGATMNKEPIHVSDQKSLAKGMINTDGLGRYSTPIESLPQKVVAAKGRPFRLYANGYAGMLVAAGEFLATTFGGVSPWDAAALKILVEEAGGKVTDFMGNDQRYDQPLKGALISNGLVHDELLALIAESVADTNREKI
jgi:myo-inositol-1(or 4)-monophosphatase